MTKVDLIKQGWAVIEGYPNHRVTTDGTVQTRFHGGHIGEWRNMSPALSKQGYAFGYISNGKGKKFYTVHRLVAISFLENPHGKKEVNHKDGNKSNNSIENLEWVTASENTSHAYKSGLASKLGSKNSYAKLDEGKVFSIKGMLEEGSPKIDIAKRFGVSIHCIADIARGRRWTHVQYP